MFVPHQICQALQKAMDESQRTQCQVLYTLHDKEVASLMKRLELQNKEELVALSKTHKDKNELARIKRELQQRLIDQAVIERHRFKSLLDKRQLELKEKHQEVQRKMDEEKIKIREQKVKDIEEKCHNLELTYKEDKCFLIQNYFINKKPLT